MVGICTALAALVLTLSCWGGLTFLRDGPLYLGWLLAANAVAALALACYRRATAADLADAETSAIAAEPYLQKLFTVRRPSSVVRRPSSPDHAGLADFDLGKTLYRWDDHEVCWARQKSLDRATLVWIDRTVAREETESTALATSHAPRATLPGVVVRHPAVLGLHAVGPCPEGRYLVTEPVAASPLAEVLQQRGLVPLEAAALTSHLTRAVQAFHDQGACHGRLTADWILVRGELEPLLCPCGFPSQAAADRLHDVQALGRLLQGWLPARPRGWQRHILAPLYRCAATAVAGAYPRALDLAHDLERAARLVQLRWRDSWACLLVIGLLAGPLLLRGLDAVLRWAGVLTYSAETGPGSPDPILAASLLLLTPAALLLGYTGTRMLVHRLLGDSVRRAAAWAAALWGEDQRLRWLQVGLFLLSAGVLTWLNLPAGDRWNEQLRVVLLVLGEFAGCWLLGVALAALVTYLEILFRSLQDVQAPTVETAPAIDTPTA